MNQLIKKILEHIPRGYFTIHELIPLIPGSEHVRYSLIKRALASGDLIQVKRGLYLLASVYQKTTIHPFTLSQLIYGPSYISLESALEWHGWIPEGVYSVTGVSLQKSQSFQTPLGLYSFHKVPQQILYLEVARVDNQDGGLFFMASPFKALLDYLYIHKKKWTSPKDVMYDMRIEEGVLSQVPKTTIKKLKGNYTNQRILKFLDMMMKEQQK